MFSPCLQTTSLTRYLIGSPTGLMSSTAALRSSSTAYDNSTEVIVIKSPVAIFVQAVGEPSEPRMHFQVRASDLPSPPFFVDLTICHILCSRLTLGQMSDCEAHGLVTGGAKGRRSKVSVLLSRGNTGSP